MSDKLYLADRARRGLVRVSKDRRQRQATNAAITSAGATTAGVGLLAGGIPGAKANGNSVWNMRSGSGKGVRRAVSTVRGAAPAASATPGGILGFRHSIHAGGLYGFDQKRKQASRKKPKSSTEAFYRGHNNGKIPPEHAIMRGMKTGQKVAHGAFGAGVAATTYGLARTRHEQVKKAARKPNDHTPGYSGTLLGVGATGAALSQGGSMYLKGQEKKYAHRAGVNVDRAGKLVPKIAGRQLQRPTESQRFAEKHYGVKPDLKQTMHPKVSDGDIGRRRLMHGVPHKTAEQAGRLRGAAAQERHFSEVFRSTGKVVRSFRTPSAIVGAAGAGGLVAMKDKNAKVKKSMVKPGSFRRVSELTPFERRGLRMSVERRRSDRTAAGMLPGMEHLGNELDRRVGSKAAYRARTARKEVRRIGREQRGEKTSPVRKGLPSYLRDVAPGIGASGTRTFRGGQKLDRGDYAYLRVRAHQSGKQAAAALPAWKGQLKRTNMASPGDIERLEAKRRPVAEASARGRLARAASQKVIRDNTPTRRPRVRPLP